MGGDCRGDVGAVVVAPSLPNLRKVFEVGGLGSDLGVWSPKSLIKWGWGLQSIHKAWFAFGWVVKECLGANPPGRWFCIRQFGGICSLAVGRLGGTPAFWAG